MRREVLGDEHVDDALDRGNSFREPLQKLITEYCWGEIWSRDGIDRRVRSLVNIGMLTALGRPNELTLHVKGALNNGCTPEEIREVILQAAIYCGIPAGVDAFKAVEEVLRLPISGALESRE